MTRVDVLARCRCIVLLQITKTESVNKVTKTYHVKSHFVILVRYKVKVRYKDVECSAYYRPTWLVQWRSAHLIDSTEQEWRMTLLRAAGSLFSNFPENKSLLRCLPSTHTNPASLHSSLPVCFLSFLSRCLHLRLSLSVCLNSLSLPLSLSGFLCMYVCITLALIRRL